MLPTQNRALHGVTIAEVEEPSLSAALDICHVQIVYIAVVKDTLEGSRDRLGDCALKECDSCFGVVCPW